MKSSKKIEHRTELDGAELIALIRQYVNADVRSMLRVTVRNGAANPVSFEVLGDTRIEIVSDELTTPVSGPPDIAR